MHSAKNAHTLAQVLLRGVLSAPRIARSIGREVTCQKYAVLSKYIAQNIFAMYITQNATRKVVVDGAQVLTASCDES